MASDVADSLKDNAALWSASAAGIFTWDVRANIVYGDAVVAAMFNLDVDQAMEGLPLQCYLAGMHPDDKARVARAIHAAILNGEPYQEEYRLQHQAGDLWVLAIGHCFRNREGSPSIYSGVIYDVTEQKTSSTDGLIDHCHAALQVAKRLGNPRLIGLLKQAVDEAGDEDLRDILRKAVRH